MSQAPHRSRNLGFQLKYFKILLYNALGVLKFSRYTSTFINTHKNFSSEYTSELSVVGEAWMSTFLLIKHGASTVHRFRWRWYPTKRACTMNSILNGMQRIRTMSLLYDRLIRVDNKLLRILQKGHDQRKRPVGGFSFYSGRQNRNRERRWRERKNSAVFSTYLRWCLGNCVSRMKKNWISFHIYFTTQTRVWIF